MSLPILLSMDAETIPDPNAGRILYPEECEGRTDYEIGTIMFAKQLAKTGNSFLPIIQHKIVCLGEVVREGSSLHIGISGGRAGTERTSLLGFQRRMDDNKPVVLTWNGTNFDMPLVSHRSMINNVPCQAFWEQGLKVDEFKWNNYISRFHTRHTDMKDVLSMYASKGQPSLGITSELNGLPGKIGTGGGNVFEAYYNGGIKEIEDYCLIDVVLVYLLYLKFRWLRGILATDDYQAEVYLVYETMGKMESEVSTFGLFLDAWDIDQYQNL